jgi:hypothetical protein
MSAHTKYGSDQIKMVGRTLDRIRQARGLTWVEVQREMGWRVKGEYLNILRGERLAADRAASCRAWIARWRHVLDQPAAPAGE